MGISREFFGFSFEEHKHIYSYGQNNSVIKINELILLSLKSY